MSSPHPEAPALDTAVLTARSALRDAGVPDPALLFLFGAGLPDWCTSSQPVTPAAFLHGGVVQLGSVPGIPSLWRGGELIFGTITTPSGPVCSWLLEDPSLDSPSAAGAHAFERGFFCWLAAQAGASILVHTSAGGLVTESTLETGDLCVVSDYLNLSGSSPLHAIGNSKLGPLLPDLTLLFSKSLLSAARDRAEALGITATEAVIAASAPVSLATPAERSWYKSAGAEAWVQGIAGPFLAAAHAGLEVLAVVALIGSEDPTGKGIGGADVQSMLLASEAAAPGLTALIAELTIPAAEAAIAAREELS